MANKKSDGIYLHDTLNIFISVGKFDHLLTRIIEWKYHT